MGLLLVRGGVHVHDSEQYYKGMNPKLMSIYSSVQTNDDDDDDKIKYNIILY